MLTQKMKKNPPEKIRDICQSFLSGLNAILGRNLFGVYIYGGAAFPDSLQTGDIDFHVIFRESLTESESLALNALHKSIAQNFPPLGGEMDGYYILLEDTSEKSPPKSQMWGGATDNSWALHCEHIRSGRCIILHGPDPRQVYPPMMWSDIESALKGELDYVEKHLNDYPDYCILNLCRLMYSFKTKDVVISKAEAAEWAHNAFPEWRRHIELAKKSYARKTTLQDRQFMLSEVKGFFRFACKHIRKSQEAKSNK